MIRLVTCMLALCLGVAHAQDPFRYTNRNGNGPAAAGDPIKLSEAVSAGTGKANWPTTPDQSGNPALTYPGTAPVNGSGNAGLAPTYFGRGTFDAPGLMRSPGGHYNLTGTTRGWADNTCLLSVNANPLSGGPQNGCGQGGFWDPWYRTVYPGQDSTATSFGIVGIHPAAKNAPATAFGAAVVTNLAGLPQTIATVTLFPALGPAAIAQINGAAGPVRVQVNNLYFGYTVPKGLTLGGVPVPGISADGTTLYVDNWTRAITPGNGAAPGTAGGTAMLPTLPYWIPPGSTNHGSGLGTGIYPNQVGMTNGSAALAGYTVTIDGNYLAEVFYVGFHMDNADVVNDGRILEFVGVNNKTGTSTWDETEPFNDMVGGANITSQIIFGGCQNDDGAGNGDCGEFLYASTGLKRVIVCANTQNSIDIGATDCVLDTKSTFGWKSTKTAGYAIWLDPGATGTPEFVLDAQGNMNASKRIFVGSGATGVTINPNGDVNASGALNAAGWTMKRADGAQTGYADAPTGNLVVTGGLAPGNYTVAAEPGCSSSYLGLQVYLTDARKPGEAAGAGSGVLALCSPPSLGATPQWLSIFDHAPAQR